MPDGRFHYAVSIHGLQDLPYPDVVPVLRELRRVVRPGGVLRLGLPDLDRSIEAYRRGDGYEIPGEFVIARGKKIRF